LHVVQADARLDLMVPPDDLRARVRHIFFWEQLQLAKVTAMTATEVERRLDLMRRVLGPTLGRLESEFLTPLINRVFGLMLRGGALPAPPPELAEQDIDIEYEGPLARSQKAGRLDAWAQVTGLLQPLLQLKPDVLDVFDFDEAVRDMALTAGLPSKWMRSVEQLAQLRQTRAEATQQQTMLNQAEQAASAAGKAAPMLKTVHEAASGMMGGQNGQMMPAGAGGAAGGGMP